jgi:hypothetical protein
MMVIVGVKEDLSKPKSSPALEVLSHDTGVRHVRVNDAHPHLMFVEYDEHQLKWADLINHMDKIGLHGRVCGN